MECLPVTVLPTECLTLAPCALCAAKRYHLPIGLHTPSTPNTI